MYKCILSPTVETGIRRKITGKIGKITFEQYFDIVWLYYERLTLEQYFDIALLYYERLTPEVMLRYGSSKSIKTPTFRWKLHLWYVLTETWQFRWIETPRMYSFLAVDWVCCNLLIESGVAHGEDYGFEFCGGTCSEVWQGKQWQWCQIRLIDRC